MRPLTPTWRHTTHSLVLELGTHAAPLPEHLTDWLIGPDGLGTTGNPAADLIGLEHQLRLDVAELAAMLTMTNQYVSQARAAVAAASTRSWSLAARKRRARARTHLERTLEEHAALTEAVAHGNLLVHQLRTFVINLNCAAGELADVAAGWSRTTAVPADVLEFANEAMFLTDAAPRATTSGIIQIAGETFGQAWRRDPDDILGDVAPESSGSWAVGYIPRTREIYATRRGEHTTPAVWLLGTGFTEDAAHTLLAWLESLMRQPNSLMAVAETVRQACVARAEQPFALSATTPPVTPRDSAGEPVGAA